MRSIRARSLALMAAFVIAALASSGLFTRFFAQASEPPPNPVASFTSLNGKIKYDRTGASGYAEYDREKAIKLQLFNSDKVLIEKPTTAEVTMTCGASLRVLEDTEFQVYFTGLRLNRGATWVNYKPVKKPDGQYIFKLSTPVCTIGIKGTNFLARFDEKTGKGLVGVREGKVEVEMSKSDGGRIHHGHPNTGGNGGGGSVELKEDQMIEFEDGKPLPEPSSFGNYLKNLPRNSELREFLDNNEIPVNKSGRKIIKRRE